MSSNANFNDDQYFKLNKSDFSQELNHIKEIIYKFSSKGGSFEKVWIPETQVTGKITKINEDCFNAVNEIFEQSSLLKTIEENTGLKNLELVAVRQNELSENEMVNSHTDSHGYVLLVDVLTSNSTFNGGNVLFRKDNNELVEIGINNDELLVAKCTNEHGVTRVTEGKRDSLAFFTRPK